MHEEPTDEPRPLTGRELQPLAAMIDRVDEPEASTLRAQLAVAHARCGCPCGCGSIDVVLPAGAAARSTRTGVGVLVEGDVLDDQGRAIGGLLLFLENGLLHDLEVWSVGEPLDLPTVDRTRLRATT